MMNNSHRLLLTTLSCTSLLMAGCAATPQTSTSHTTSPLQAQATLAGGEHLLMLNEQHWLSIGPDHKLQLGQQANGTATIWQDQWHGEFLDSRIVDGKLMTVSVDDNQRLHLSTFVRSEQSGQYQRVQDAVGGVINTPLEGLCLYAPRGDAMQVFLLDENANGQQLMLTPASADASTTQLNTTLLRQFATAPGAEYCVVDDDRDTLYISEQAVGVWQMNARAESDPSRTMVEMASPFGHIQGEAGALAIQGNSLWIAEAESDRIHQYQLDNGQYLGVDTLAANGAAVAIDTLLVSPLSGQAGVFDKHSEQLLSLRLPSQPAINVSDRIATIAATAETDPVSTAGDAADDPAIWVNPHNPAASLILGTNKKHALNVYDLNGKQVQQLPVGRVNNVDVRQQFTLRGQPMDIATASHRDHKSISLFAINPDTGAVSSAGEIATTLESVYGLCMYKNSRNQMFAFINSENGEFEQYQILDSDNGWHGKRVRQFAVASQPEGCVADDRAGRLFLGEENRAVWTLGAEPAASTRMTEVATLGEKLVADIEGMDIYQTEDANYLVVSSQGNDSYLVYEAEAPFAYVGRFRVGLNANKGIDGASETDGLTVTSANLGDQYPQGLLVVQDGRNLLPEQHQNFKYVDWRDIRALLTH